jgi:hypothetical protein
VPTLSYVCEFDLRTDGPDAEPFLTNAVRTWPELYAELEGVKGTRLLANAFGLAGEYNYEWRVDIESLATLEVIDNALKSDDERWRSARREWFASRSRVRARLLQRADDESDDRDGDGLIHVVTSYRAPHEGLQKARTTVGEAWRSVNSVVSVEHHAAVVRPYVGHAHESSARLNSLAELDQVVDVGNGRIGEVVGPASSRVYGELREVDGALFSGA